jgi:hypothetical protein
MMKSIIFDHDAIGTEMVKIKRGSEPEVTCEACEDGGWEMFGLGINDPHFRICPKCGNPNNHPCP